MKKRLNFLSRLAAFIGKRDPDAIADDSDQLDDENFLIDLAALDWKTPRVRRRIRKQRISVPRPGFVNDVLVIKPSRRNFLPFRYFDELSADAPLVYGDLKTCVRTAGRLPALLAFVGHFARYDVVSLDPVTGRLQLSLGTERALDPEEYGAATPAGHVQLCAIFTTKDGCELIDQSQWLDHVNQSRIDDHLRWLEYCRNRLPRTMRKLRTGEKFKLSGYGDSTTALGGRIPEHVSAPGGPARDTVKYFECYGADWLARVRFGATNAMGAKHQLGWNWYLKAAIEERSSCIVEYENWGIAGTTSACDTKLIDSFNYPNASNEKRLQTMLNGNPDLVTLAVGVNDIGENLPTRANLVAIGRTIQRTGADLIVIGPCRPNPRFTVYRDDRLWKETHDLIIAAAEDLDAAYFATWELYGDGNEGAMGLSRRSHCASSMGNHPGARELATVGRYLAKLIP